MQEGPLSVRIDTAAVLVGTCGSLIFPRWKIQMGVVAGRLVRFGAGTAQVGHKQSADAKGIVPDHFGVEPELALPG